MESYVPEEVIERQLAAVLKRRKSFINKAKISLCLCFLCVLLMIAMAIGNYFIVHKPLYTILDSLLSGIWMWNLSRAWKMIN